MVYKEVWWSRKEVWWSRGSVPATGPPGPGSNLGRSHCNTV